MNYANIFGTLTLPNQGGAPRPARSSARIGAGATARGDLAPEEFHRLTLRLATDLSQRDKFHHEIFANYMVQKIFDWPQLPALPPPGQPVLVRVATAPARREARQELRNVLRQILAAWSSFPPAQLPLRETPTGPVSPEPLAGHALDISLSYAKGEGWIGLRRGGLIGIDVMRVERIPEKEKLAELYLDQDALDKIRNSPDPDLAFAIAWTTLEARLKCWKQPLRERAAHVAVRLGACRVQHLTEPDGGLVAVATAANEAHGVWR